MSPDLDIKRLRVVREQAKSLLVTANRFAPGYTIVVEDALYREASTIIDQARILLGDPEHVGLVPDNLTVRDSLSFGQYVPVDDVIVMVSSLDAVLTELLREAESASRDVAAEVEVLEAKLTEAEARSVLINDDELRDRCLDLLVRPGKADTAVRDALVVLEHRVRVASGLGDEHYGVGLIDKALSPKSGELIMPGTQPEREGAHQLFRGMIGTFKNPTSHRIAADYDKTRARQVVGLVDTLLRMLQDASRRTDGSPG